METTKTLSVLSFGAGRQGTAIAVMMARHREVLEAKLNYTIPQHVVFSDTGDEEQAVYDNIEIVYKLLKKSGYTCHLISKDGTKLSETDRGISTIPFYTKGESDSVVGMLSRQCTNEYKIQPVRRLTRNLLGLKPGERAITKDRKVCSETWLGISTNEAQRAKPSNVKWITNRFPLIDLGMNVHDCVNYVKKELGYTPPRSACFYCPFRSPTEWQTMHDERPEEFAQAVEFDKSLRSEDNKFSRVKNLNNPAYLSRYGIPLEDAITKGQLNLFAANRSGGCDTGYCGC